MKESDKNIIQIFKKYFNGNVSRIELRELEKATTEDDYVRDAKEGIDKLSTVDRDTTKANLESRLAKRIYKNETRIVPMQWLKFAAGFAILLAIGLFIWRPISNQSVSSNTEKSTKSIELQSRKSEPTGFAVDDLTKEKTSYDDAKDLNNNGKLLERSFSTTIEAENTSDFIVEIPQEESTSNAPENNPDAEVNFDIEVYNQGLVSSSNTNIEEYIPPTKENLEPIAYTESILPQNKTTVIDGVAIESDIVSAQDNSIEEKKEESNSAPKSNLDNLASTSAGVGDKAKKRRSQSANRQIQGVITDEFGEPLIGAGIVEKGTTNGTITDIDGTYSLELSEESESLVISYTGFDTQEIVLGNEDQVDISLDQGVELSEVVVTSLGNEKADDILKNSYPDYPIDGNAGFKTYIQENLVYPQPAQDANIKGKVILLFNVNAEGRPFDIEVKKSLGYGCDEEAIRLLKNGPDWKQGNRAGKTRLVVRFK